MQGYNGENTRGWAITKEGEQYKYYQGVTEEEWNSSCGRQKRPNILGQCSVWWLRSPLGDDGNSYCRINDGGNSGVTRTTSDCMALRQDFAYRKFKKFFRVI